MTPRQREFCLHYLLGLPAARAARAAGYAESTCEKNAAAILSSPAIHAYIETRRKAASLVTLDDLVQAKARIMRILTEGDDRAAAVAFHGLLRLRSMQYDLAASQPDDQELNPQQNTNNIQDQTADNQRSEFATENLPIEADCLPDGAPAFDRSFSKEKPVPATHKPKHSDLRIFLVPSDRPALIREERNRIIAEDDAKRNRSG